MSEIISASDVLDQFYDAFSRGDLQDMMAVWSEDAGVVCIHPGGPPITGFSAVHQSWRQILGAEDLKITASVVDHWLGEDVATFVVTEHLYVPSRSIHAETLATNGFRKQQSGWKMVLHHGSPKPVSANTAPGNASQGVH